MSTRLNIFVSLLLIPYLFCAANTQQTEEKKADNDNPYSGLKWRGIGPAFTSGRIADFAVNPINPKEYYVAVASGHVWKTVNAGITFEPIFDKQGVYSIGCVTIDPQNPHTIWVGTGENNHQRALGYGNGVYKSQDNGKSWTCMGLKESRQIGDILIDPRNSEIIYVAAEGSVWGPGGERGLFKSNDGGKSWEKSLSISENTGVNNVVCDPRNPDVLYATSEQRRRHAFTKIGGGPESAVYKSINAGKSWHKIMTGLPKVDIGGMGIDISPVNPDILYLIVEAADDQGGFYRSGNRGASWEKMSDYHSSGQYYNEIYCDPQSVDRVYSVETVSKVTNDGGKTWQQLGLDNRHVDDHALWIDPVDNDHFLIGGDGGIYETYDGGKLWDYKENLPVTQFYRVFVDNSRPFYWVYGGTQDNNSMGGPSRTISEDGIVHADWVVTQGGDGFWSAVDPQDPNIVYAEYQYGGMCRYDKKSGESIPIRPEPRQGEDSYKWNWDTPLIISNHKASRIYCAANKVFRSDDRGDSWEVISEDLSTGIDRNTWPVMGKFWSADAVAKDKSTSLFGTIISLAESKLDENLLFAGTDDGLIQISEDGKNWRKASPLPEVPQNTYISDILPSRFNKKVLYASASNLLRDDFKPYLFVSQDLGKSWTSISSNLPVNGSVHTINQDFIKEEMLFVGTEFGIYISPDHGKTWSQLGSGIPDVKVCDIAIQERECDLAIATFGRGFFILDNYAPLRELSPEILSQQAHLFQIKDADQFMMAGARYGQGSNYFRAPNPEYGAHFTIYMKEVPKTLKEIRTEKEKEFFKSSKPIPQPIPAERLAEKTEKAPHLRLIINDLEGQAVKVLQYPASKGLQRVSWDLSYASPRPLKIAELYDPIAKPRSGLQIIPGDYTVNLDLITRSGVQSIAKGIRFKVKALENTTLPTPDRGEMVGFLRRAAEVYRNGMGIFERLLELQKKTETLKQAAIDTPLAMNGDLFTKLEATSGKLQTLFGRFELVSDSPSMEENPPQQIPLLNRLEILYSTHSQSTSSITKNEKVALEILLKELPAVHEQLIQIEKELRELADELDKLGAPRTPEHLPLTVGK